MITPRYFMLLTSSIALLLIKMVMGNFNLLGAWKTRNLVFEMLRDNLLIQSHSYNFFYSKFIVFSRLFKSLFSQ